MQYLKRLLVNSLLSFVVVGMITPSAALADKKLKKFTASSLLSNQTIRALNLSAAKFNKTGEIHEVEFVVPTKHGDRTCAVIPHNDSAAVNLESYLVGQNGQEADGNKVVQFKTTDAGNDFCRITLITGKNGKIQKRDIIGFVRNRGVVYNVNGKKAKKDNADVSTAQIEYAVSEVTSDEVKEMAAACGMTDAAHQEDVDFANLVSGDLPAPEAAAASSARVLKLATEADYEYYSKYGAGANARILSMIDGLNAIYAQLNVRIQVIYQQAWTVPNDPYTKSESGALLMEVVNLWEKIRRENPRFTHNSPGLVHLFTGRDLDGNTIGSAWIGTVCTIWGYGVSSNWNSNQDMVMLVAAHELGHNFGLHHDVQIMAPAITGSRTFSAASKSAAQAYIATKSEACLARDESGPRMLTISGRVTAQGVNGAPLPGIIINGGTLGEAITGPDGSYAFTNVPYATPVTLSPLPQGKTESFNPPAFGTTLMNDASVNFVALESNTPTPPSSGKRYAINGYVRFTGVAKRITGANITLVNDATGETFGAKSGASGQFSFKNVKPGNYTLSAQKGAGYIISRSRPGKLSITNKSISGEVFNARCASGYSVNIQTRTCDAN